MVMQLIYRLNWHVLGEHVPFKCNTDKTGNVSIDRIDSSIGYLPSNIQLVDKRINMLKNILPQDEFIDLCKLVANHN